MLKKTCLVKKLNGIWVWCQIGELAIDLIQGNDFGVEVGLGGIDFSKNIWAGDTRLSNQLEQPKRNHLQYKRYQLGFGQCVVTGLESTVVVIPYRFKSHTAYMCFILSIFAKEFSDLTRRLIARKHFSIACLPLSLSFRIRNKPLVKVLIRRRHLDLFLEK